TLLTEKTIDLHVDASSADLKSNEILEYQLNKFEKAFDNALLLNLKELKIIHGVGAGILRNEIHKRISTKKEVRFFEDSDKERFGFGSTIIYF
ncbi:MAG: Smr/MutS family protein, partial [Cyclobacteriaceae bacterium]|nr:Smr/MutS family protein [Cyclobacteriaceae bacterium]